MEKRDRPPKGFYKSLEVPVDFLVDWCRWRKSQTFWASFRLNESSPKRETLFQNSHKIHYAIQFNFSRHSVQTCRDSRWSSEALCRMGRKQRETVLFFSQLQRSLARFSQVVAAFFFSLSPRKITKQTASRQANCTATTVAKKTGEIGIVMWRLFFKLKISLLIGRRTWRKQWKLFVLVYGLYWSKLVQNTFW